MEPIQLRDYQFDTAQAVRKLRPRSRTCVQAPTGAGKSVIMADLLTDPKTPQMVLTHRKVLLDQLSDTMRRYGIVHGFRAAGKPTNLSAPIQLGMIQTEFNNTFKKKKWPLHKCKRLHIDEIHAVKAGTAVAIADAYVDGGASLVGWTASPREISHIVDNITVAATVPQLIRAGYLVEPIVYGPDMPDVKKLDSVKKLASGDYSPSGLAKVWKVKKIFARVLQQYRLLNPGCPAILFAPGVAESLWFAQHLTAKGVRSAHVDGKNVWLDGEFYKSDSAARKAVFSGVRAGDIRVVCNRFVLREGFDCPSIGHAILACPFGARSNFVQAAGRVLRPFPGRQFAIIQDHAGNWLNHPRLDSGEAWDIDTPERILAAERKQAMRDGDELEAIACPQCNATRIMGAECPQCGYESTTRSRNVVQLDGTLRVIQGRAYKPRRVKPQHDDAYQWARMYHSNRKHHPDRTPEQIYCYFAVQNNWRWLPRDLPLMPTNRREWYIPVGKTDVSKLR